MKAEMIIEEMQEHYTPFDMFREVTNLDELINLIVAQSNLYSQHNAREFQTNVKEMIAFLGINYIKSINQLPAVQSYCECGQFIGSEGIRNTIRRQDSKTFLDNAKSYKDDEDSRFV